MTGALAAGRRAAASVLLALAALLAFAAGAAEQRLPDGTLALPPLARVTDTTGTLDAGQRQALEAKLAAFEQARGTQIAIVMVGSTAPEPIADFAQRLGDAWQIGRAGVGDGLLIVVARDDRRIWIAVAKALEGAVPDLAAARVIREQITPRFRDGDYAAGLHGGLDAIFRLIEGEGLPPPAGPTTAAAAGEGVLGLLMPLLFFGAAAAAALRRVFGVPGALAASGGSGLAIGVLMSSPALGVAAAVLVLIIGLSFAQASAGRVLGGRRGGVFAPGGWSAGAGRPGGGRGGGWSSGGGGNFGGGGAGGRW
jgi:uncharacterized protein